MAEELGKTEEEKCKEVTEARMWFTDSYDYTAVKIVYELAKAFKAQFPNVQLPDFEKYKDRETEAIEKRRIINEDTSS